MHTKYSIDKYWPMNCVNSRNSHLELIEFWGRSVVRTNKSYKTYGLKLVYLGITSCLNIFSTYWLYVTKKMFRIIYLHVNVDNKITPSDYYAWVQNLQTKNHKTWHVDSRCCFESGTYKFKFLSIQPNPSPHPLHNFKPWSSKTQNELLLLSLYLSIIIMFVKIM